VAVRISLNQCGRGNEATSKKSFVVEVYESEGRSVLDGRRLMFAVSQSERGILLTILYWPFGDNSANLGGWMRAADVFYLLCVLLNGSWLSVYVDRCNLARDVNRFQGANTSFSPVLSCQCICSKTSVFPRIRHE
jgi:hypothetical protein